jgi:hypothetical protein
MIKAILKGLSLAAAIGSYVTAALWSCLYLAEVVSPVIAIGALFFFVIAPILVGIRVAVWFEKNR